MNGHYQEQREKDLGTNNHKDVISSDLDSDMKNSWGTDPVIFRALNKEFNFALDAAANDKKVNGNTKGSMFVIFRPSKMPCVVRLVDRNELIELGTN